MTKQAAWDGFSREIEAALDLLSDRADAVSRDSDPREHDPDHSLALASALPSLLAQCQDMIDAPDARQSHLLRSVHHLACTGGTLISRCIAAMPNAQVLSEVDPLSPMAHGHPFVPTDLIGLAKFGSRPPDDATLVDIFRAGIGVLQAAACRRGANLVLRDHAHGQFSYGSDVAERPTLRDILRRDYEVQSLVTVRHPLDSYLSLQRNGWAQFDPDGLEEYARRYLVFLDRYAGVEILCYEDFVADPEARMQQICEVLGLRYNEAFLQVFQALQLSGDSGRSGDVIAPRPRFPVAGDLAHEAGQSPSYNALCTRLNYDPAPT